MTVTIPTVPLGALLPLSGAPNVIKIDVEGAAALVLAGASATLENRPIVICEVASESASLVTSLLRKSGYTLLDGEDDLQEVVSAPSTTVAVPE